MDSTVITAIVQAIVTIVTTLSGVWALFNKQSAQVSKANADLEKRLTSRLSNVEHQVKLSSLRKPEILSNDHKV